MNLPEENDELERNKTNLMEWRRRIAEAAHKARIDDLHVQMHDEDPYPEKTTPCQWLAIVAISSALIGAIVWAVVYSLQP
jgi:hypothetical protein